MKTIWKEMMIRISATRRESLVRRMVVMVGLFGFIAFPVHAQTFSSGSTGEDGALDLSSCPQICEVQLPESGVLNYTTVNIPSGKTLRFKVNSRNTPVIMLAQGTVTISGAIDVSASGDPITGRSKPGPGGFYGSSSSGQNGFGPGGGNAGIDNGNGKWVGPLSLSPIVGGSGGAWPGCCGTVIFGGSGGGGIVVASSTSIVGASGSLIVASGNAGSFNQSCFGSGGAIRFVANQITISGTLYACTSTSCGVVRLEAPTLQQINFTGSSQPAAVLSTIGGSVLPSGLPSLNIVSIGGFAVPTYAGSRFDTVDLLLPSQLSDPINVSVHATNIPLGTQVAVGFVAGSSQATSTPGTLSGTFESSTATCGISGLNRNQVSYLLATAIFDPPAGAMNFNPKGSDRVSKVRIESSINAKPKFVFLRSNGNIIDQAKLPKAFLQQLGL